MEPTIAAKDAARPAARFPRPSARARERRLGLRVETAFRAAAWRPTEIRQESASAYARLRAGCRSITPTRTRRPEPGRRVRTPAPLPSIEYPFVQGGTRIHKTVHYFLMEPVGGDLDRHDHEFQRVRWVRFEDARSLLTLDTERALVETAAGALHGPGDPGSMPNLNPGTAAGGPTPRGSRARTRPRPGA